MLGRGRPPKRPAISHVCELTPADLAGLKRGKASPIKRFRDSHHLMARLFASGMRVSEVAEACGYSVNRVSIFHNDPAFQELIAQKRHLADEVFKDRIMAYNDLILSNGMKAERKIADKLDDDDESEEMSVRELVSIARDAADRVGLSKRSVQTNINLDFASMLDKAIARSSRPALPRSGDLKLVQPSQLPAVIKSPDRGTFLRRF